MVNLKRKFEIESMHEQLALCRFLKSFFFIFMFLFLVTYVFAGPQVDFVSPTPDDGENISDATIPINISVNTAGEHYSFIDVNRDLRAWYRFDNGSNNGQDYSLYSNDLTGRNSPSFITDPSFPYNLTLDVGYSSLNKYMDTNDHSSLDITGAISISLWVEFDTDGSADSFSTVLTKGRTATGTLDSTAPPYYIQRNSANSLRFCIWNSNYVSVSCLGSPAVFGPGETHHVVAMWDGTVAQDNMKLYLDGVLNSTSNQTSVTSLPSTSHDLDIGGDSNRVGDNRFFMNGRMDEIMIFARELQADEVKSLYNATMDPFDHNIEFSQGIYNITGYGAGLDGEINNTEVRTYNVSQVIYTDSIEAARHRYNKNMSVSMSLDDCGFADLYFETMAKKYNIQTTIFCNGININASDYNASNFGTLKSSHLRDVSDSATFDVGSHTWNHTNMATGSPNNTIEIVQNRDFLQNASGAGVIGFAYPYGAIGEKSTILNNHLYARTTVEETRDADISDLGEVGISSYGWSERDGEADIKAEYDAAKAIDGWYRHFDHSGSRFLTGSYSLTIQEEDRWDNYTRIFDYIQNDDAYYGTEAEIASYISARDGTFFTDLEWNETTGIATFNVSFAYDSMFVEPVTVVLDLKESVNIEVNNTLNITLNGSAVPFEIDNASLKRVWFEVTPSSSAQVVTVRNGTVDRESVDMADPVIQNVSSNGFFINWTTDKNSDSIVYWSDNASRPIWQWNIMDRNTTRTTNHFISIPIDEEDYFLNTTASGTLMYYAVASTDDEGRSGWDDNSESYFNVTIGVADDLDETYPQFSSYVESPSDPSTYNQTYYFNVTLLNTNGTVGIDFNDVNYTLSNDSDIFFFNITDLAVGTYNYYYWGYGNGTNENYNQSETLTYTINQNTSSCDVLFNETSPITYLSEFRVYTNCDTGFALYRNGTIIANNSVQTLGANLYNFTVTRNDTTNYSNIFDDEFFTVDKATPVLTRYLNGVDGNLSIGYPNTVNASAYTTAGVLNIFRNSTDVISENELDVDLSANYYEYEFNVTGDENYTDLSSVFLYVEVNQSTSSCDVLFNETSPVVNGSMFKSYTNCDTAFVLYRNGTIIANNSEQNLSVNLYNFTVTRNDTVNYSNIFDDEFFSISEADPTYHVNLSQPVSQSVTVNNNATYTITITNNGTGSDNYTVSAINTDSVDVLVTNISTTSQMISGSTTQFTLTVGNSEEGNYTVVARVVSNTNSSSTFDVSMDTEFIREAEIMSTLIRPYAVVNGSNATIKMNATAFDSLWVSVVKPDSNVENFTMTNATSMYFNNTTQTGRYNVTFYANNSLGSIINSTDYFESFVAAASNSFNVSVVNSSESGINSTWAVYYRDGTVLTNSSSSGNYSVELPDTLVNFEFTENLAGKAKVLLREINLTEDNNKQIIIDRHTDSDNSNFNEYKVSYGVHPEHNYTNATFTIYYDDLTISDESRLRVWECNSTNYNYTTRVCLNDLWTQITTNITQNESGDFFQIERVSFSGFSIDEDVSSVSSGSAVDSGTGSTCKISSWECGEWSDCVSGEQIRSCKSNCREEKNESRWCIVEEEYGEGVQDSEEVTPNNYNNVSGKDKIYYSITIVAVLILIGIVFVIVKKAGFFRKGLFKKMFK